MRFRLKHILYRIPAIILLLFALLAADYFLYPRFSKIGGRSFNTGQNASWLNDSWYLGNAKESPKHLIHQLAQHQIRDAYFHVRYIKKDGTLRFHDAAAARDLTDTMHQNAPDIKSIAWIYIGNERGLTGVDIGNIQVRKTIVRQIIWLIEKCGFDGVQLDYEICPDGDTNFLVLLTEIRKALPKDKLLSVATPMCLLPPLRKFGWSEKYFSQMAAKCDQMAVMCYDSGVYWPRLYVWLVRQQAIRVTRAAAKGNPQCSVVLGIPTYEKGGFSHHAYAENIRMALKGVREGLANPNAKVSAFQGVAIFADYTTDKDEWKTYRDLWLERTK
jgi:hypothetical protein